MNTVASPPRAAGTPPQPGARTTHAKPVRLEANCTGLWHRVLDFDAADETAEALVRQGVEALATVSPHVAFRICMNGLPGGTLLNYSARHGWTEGKP